MILHVPPGGTRPSDAAAGKGASKAQERNSGATSGLPCTPAVMRVCSACSAWPGTGCRLLIAGPHFGSAVGGCCPWLIVRLCEPCQTELRRCAVAGATAPQSVPCEHSQWRTPLLHLGRSRFSWTVLGHGCAWECVGAKGRAGVCDFADECIV